MFHVNGRFPPEAKIQTETLPKRRLGRFAKTLSDRPAAIAASAISLVLLTLELNFRQHRQPSALGSRLALPPRPPSTAGYFCGYDNPDHNEAE